jgi:hypothetical protein
MWLSATVWVIQSDLGKTVHEGRFVRTSYRLHPPQDLLIAISKLQSGECLGQNKINEYIDEMTSRCPDLSHPGVEADILYPSTYDHLQGCDPIKRIYWEAP